MADPLMCAIVLYVDFACNNFFTCNCCMIFFDPHLAHELIILCYILSYHMVLHHLNRSLNADVSNAVTVLQREPGWAELESGSFAVLSAEPPYLLLWATSRYVLATGLSLDILRARTPSTLDCEQTDVALRRRLFEECVTHQTPQHCMVSMMFARTYLLI
jgi:hypothetical protein